MSRTPVLLAWSGGKDAAWTLHLLRQRDDVDVVGLLTTVTREYERISMQGIRRSVLHAQARATGAAMILALNTDDSVRRQGKGDDRPINPLENRAAVVAALASVDVVTWFDDDTPAALIELVKPDILVKGGDWTVDKIVGSQETLARGGKVYSIPFLHQTSTTQTLAKIRAAEAADK